MEYHESLRGFDPDDGSPARPYLRGNLQSKFS